MEAGAEAGAEAVEAMFLVQNVEREAKLKHESESKLIKDTKAE